MKDREVGRIEQKKLDSKTTTKWRTNDDAYSCRHSWRKAAAKWIVHMNILQKKRYTS